MTAPGDDLLRRLEQKKLLSPGDLRGLEETLPASAAGGGDSAGGGGPPSAPAESELACRRCGHVVRLEVPGGAFYACPRCPGVLVPRLRPQAAEPEPAAAGQKPKVLPSEVQVALQAGAEVVDKFVLLAKVGEGGGGRVYRAWDVEFDRVVALKMLSATMEVDLERTRVEVQTIGGLCREGIPQVYETGLHEGTAFISMQYVESRPVAAGTGSVSEVLRIARDVARILHSAHAHGVVHRDVKPDNILVDPTGKVWLTDFGIAKRLQVAEVDRLTRTGQIMGTVHFMSPEQAAGENLQLDVRTDVYSLGATLYTWLTGRLPAEGTGLMQALHQVMHVDPPAPSRLRREVPPEADAIVAKAMEKAPSARYATAAELAEDLDRFLEGRPIAAARVGRLRRARRLLRRHRTAAGALVCSLALVGFGALEFLRRGAAEREVGELVRAIVADLARAHVEALELRRGGATLPVLAAAAERTLRSEPFQRVRDTAWNDASFHYSLGRIYRISGDLARAEDAQRQALALAPEYGPAQYEMGVLLCHRRQRAIDDQHRAWGSFGCYLVLVQGKLSSLTDGEAAGEATGESAAGRAMGEQASAFLRQAASCLAPDSVEHATATALVHLLRDEPEEACRDLERARERDPGAEDPLYFLSLLHFQAGRLPDALALLDRALEEDRGNATFVMLRAQVRLSAAPDKGAGERSARHDVRQALDDYRKLTDLQPKNDEAWERLGAMCVAMAGHRRYSEGTLPRNIVDDAFACLNRALELNPDNPWAHADRAVLRGLRVLAWREGADSRGRDRPDPENEKAEALADFATALRMADREASFHFARGLFRFALGDAAGATADFEHGRERGNVPSTVQRIWREAKETSGGG